MGKRSHTQTTIWMKQRNGGPMSDENFRQRLDHLRKTKPEALDGEHMAAVARRYADYADALFALHLDMLDELCEEAIDE